MQYQQTIQRWQSYLAAFAVGTGLSFMNTPAARTDEGMWLLNEPPREILAEKYKFELTPQWLEHVQKASVRLMSGGSGSFVSPDGLLITNHHVGADALQKLTTKDRNLIQQGFLAKTRREELKCPDLEINVLMEITDVTGLVNQSVKEGMTAGEALAARRATMANLEKEALAANPGNRCDVVTLYQGGAYHLYRYKKYTDVRLVMAPEAAIASFGGDVDNFEFPRFNLDICFFRAYENNQPAKVEHYLKMNRKGVQGGDLVFVTGHPGTTNRAETLPKLLHRRDHTLPYNLARLRAMEAALVQYAETSPEANRLAASEKHRYANSRKAFSGQFQGLCDPTLLEAKKQQENNFFHAVAVQGGNGGVDWKAAYDKISEAQKNLKEFEEPYYLLERGDAIQSELFTIARHLVRMVKELGKPSSERLREYRDSNLESLKLHVMSPAPIHKELEKVKLKASLSFLVEKLGRDCEIVRKSLANFNPEQRAAQLVESKLYNLEFRQKVLDQGMPGLEVNTDPMIELAVLLDKDARTFRALYEEYEEVERQAFGTLARLKFNAFGKTLAPDATFTLRLAFGKVEGYELDADTRIRFHTTLGGVFEKAERLQYREPFDLPARWKEGKGKLKLETPFNFVSTADTIGGNSGSPVLNRAGEFIGINFDRNRHGLVRNFLYTDVQARHIAVDVRTILHVLETLYDCPELVKELAP